MNTGSGPCIGFQNNVRGGGIRLVLQDCSQAPAWVLENLDSSNSGLIAENTSFCMSAADLSARNDTALISRTCALFDDAAQTFRT